MAKIYESFRWLRDDLSYAGPIGKKAQFKGVALYPTISGNHREYVAKELEASARTLVGKPVTLNHNSDVMLGNVRWAEHEDGRIEYVIELKSGEYIQKLRDKTNMSVEEYVDKWDKQPVYGVSVEANYRYHDEQCSDDGVCKITPYGIIFNALSLVEDPEVPGVDGTTIELMEMVHEQSVDEARIVWFLLNDHVMFHGMPRNLAESYDQEVVQKMKVKKKKKEKTVKHKDVITVMNTSGDPRAQLLMEQEDTGAHDCGDNEHWDVDQEKCVPDEAATEQEECPEGQVRDPETGECVPKATETECPEGMHMDDQGKCVPDQPPHNTAVPELPSGTATAPVGVTTENLLGEPFADYTDMADCVAKNQDKDDPEAYCAGLENKVEGETLLRLGKRMLAVEAHVAEIKQLLKQKTRLAEVEAVKRKQNDDDITEQLNSVKETVDFNVELMKRNVASKFKSFEQQLRKVNGFSRNLSEWLKTHEARDKRQCKSIGELNEKTRRTAAAIQKLVGVTSVLHETLQTVQSELPALRGIAEKYPVLDSAYKELNKRHVDFVADNQAKLRALERQNKKDLQETKGSHEKFKELEDKIETIASHVKPGFKAKPQPPDAEPVEEVVSRPYA